MSRSGKAAGRTPTITGDVTDPTTLVPALHGVDAIVHCVGLIIEPGSATFEKVVAEGTRNLVEACRETSVRRCVFISALGTRRDAAARYHKTKWEAEEAIRQSGLEYTILRPSIVFGREDKFINKFLRMQFTPLPGGGKNCFQPIYVKDLAAIIAESLVNPAAVNQTFDAGGPEQFTFRELMRRAHEASGKRKLEFTIPMPIMRVLAAIHDPFQKIWPRLALFTKDQYLMLQEDSVSDNRALMAAFPEIKLHSLQEGLAEYVHRRGE